MGTDEASLIARVRAAFAGRLGPDALDLADDAALLPAVAPGATRVVTTDAVVEGVDFDEALYPLQLAGRRAILQNVSDLSAMGAVPVGFVWSLAIPPRWLFDDRVAAFCDGAAAACAETGLLLLGGDLSSTTGPLVASITAFGDVAGAPLRRCGARVGDGIYVDRPLGASAAGLRALLAARPGPAYASWHAALPQDVRACVDAHTSPAPATTLARALVGRASSCIDVSDGLAIDLARLCAASGVGAAIAALAVASGATSDDALHGGEDFALLFTSAAPFAGALRIGTVVAGQGVTVDGAPIAPRGFDHFARS